MSMDDRTTQPPVVLQRWTILLSMSVGALLSVIGWLTLFALETRQRVIANEARSERNRASCDKIIEWYIKPQEPSHRD